MKTLRNNWPAYTIVAVLAMGAVVTMGAMGLSQQDPAGAILAAAAGAGGVSATADAVNIYLKIPDVNGESTAHSHQGSIDVQSWSWGVSEATSGGGGAIGRTIQGHVSIVKLIDKASPLLFKQCTGGTTEPLVTVELVRSDGQTYMKYDLKEMAISSISVGDVNGDGIPDETIEMSFTGATLTYTQFDAADKPIGQTSASWSATPTLL